MTVIFQPTRWSWIVLVILWGLRASSLWAQRRWDVPIECGDLIGFAWDVPIAISLLSLSRLFSMASSRAGYFQTHVWSRYVGLTPLATAPVFTRIADLFYCSMTGARFSSDAFVYISLGNAKLLLDRQNPMLTGVFIVTIVGLAFTLDRDGGRFLAKSSGGRPTIWVAILLTFLSLAGIGLPFRIGFHAGEEQRALWVPDVRFLREWLVWRGVIVFNDRSALVLPEPLKRRFVQLGLMPETPFWKGYPLSRATLDDTPFPYPETANAELGPPNLVLIVVEQLGREFIYPLSGELQGVMPNLSELALRASLITEYQSVTHPTMPALIVALCSTYSATPKNDLNESRASESLEHTPLTCLPAILKERGYRTVYIQAGNNGFAGTDGFLRAHGFYERFDDDNIRRVFPGRHESVWGVHDDALAEFAQIKLAKLGKARARDRRPFFLLAQTMDMHAPGHPNPLCSVPESLFRYAPDDDSKTMLQAAYCTDKAIGQLVRSIIDDPVRSKDTVVAITGDHPADPLMLVKSPSYKRGHPYAGWSGPMPLLLFDPTHQLPSRIPVLSGHIDLAPTLLHMLNIVDVPNAMTGHSIFGTRPKFPQLVGRAAPQNAAIYRPDRTRKVKTRRLLTLCRQGKRIIANDAQAITACELWSWLRWQDALWRYKLIYPPQ
jgi:arylsulfatase A-like enzyme